MKLGIMQPYFFPYIGYIQLINSVDKFVLYDDVNYIKQGWINRNRMLINGAPSYFTIPLKNRSSFVAICDTEVADNPEWKVKMLRSIEGAYKKAPFFKESFTTIERIINTSTTSLATLAAESIKGVMEYLEITTQLVESSTIYNNSDLSGQDRIIDICLQEKADTYINASGGKGLYSKEEFLKNNIELRFIQPAAIEYRQYNNTFVPWLSIIDVIMFNPREKVQEYLENFELV